MNKTLFVGNIPYGALESELAAHFSQIGTVEHVNFVIDWRRGRFQGYGFVRMSAADADRAVAQLDGRKFQDRVLKITEARGSHRTELERCNSAQNARPSVARIA